MYPLEHMQRLKFEPRTSQKKKKKKNVLFFTLQLLQSYDFCPLTKKIVFLTPNQPLHDVTTFLNEM